MLSQGSGSDPQAATATRVPASGSGAVVVESREFSPGELAIPDRIESVKLLYEIGRGALGVVWLGLDEVLHRPVAVKFLPRAVASEDDPRFEAFVQGARAAAALAHPGLTAVHSAGVVGGVPYLVMEYVDGPTLAEVIARHGAMEAGQALLTLIAVCEAVEALHAEGIVHRDIKPSNILIDHGLRVVVTDFGLALRRRGGEGPVAGVCGTPRYMAPEMFEGQVSARTDVFALGVTLYEMLCGEPPADSWVLAGVAPRGELELGALQQRGAPEGMGEGIGRAGGRAGE